MEADFYLELKQLKKQGKIIDFELQPKFNLIPSFKKHGVTYRKMDYIGDFLVFVKEGNDVKKVLYDVKGYSKDSTFLLKQKLFNYKYDIPLVLITWYQGQWMTVQEKENIIKQRKKRK